MWGNYGKFCNSKFLLVFFFFYTIYYLKRLSEYREALLACVSLFTPSWAPEKGGLCSHIMASNEVEEGEALMSDEAGEGDVFEDGAVKGCFFIFTLLADANPGMTPNPTPVTPQHLICAYGLLISPHVNRHSSSHLLLWRLSLRWQRKGEKPRNGRHSASITFCSRHKLNWSELKVINCFFFSLLSYFRPCLCNPYLCVMELQIK